MKNKTMTYAVIAVAITSMAYLSKILFKQFRINKSFKNYICGLNNKYEDELLDLNNFPFPSNKNIQNGLNSTETTDFAT